MINNVIKALENVKSAAVFTHIMPDGDALGSSFSLKNFLEEQGKKCDVYIADSVPERLKFLCGEYFTEFSDKNYDTFIALDAGDLKRLDYYGEVFSEQKNTLLIDHHATNTKFASINYVLPDASSTGEVLFEIFKKAGYRFSKETAKCLYAAIASDTGCFKFESTGVKGHIYAAELIETGINFAKINRLLFDTEEKNAYKLKGYAMSVIKYFAEGKIASVTVTNDDLLNLGCKYEDTEGLSDVPRVVKGVEVGLILKEFGDKIKVSIRTNEYADATKIASVYGGGGHIRASGCVSTDSASVTLEKLVKKAEELL